MKIVIKKRVNLDFLGEEYKEGYLVFKSISVEEFKKISEQAKKSEGDSADFLLEVLEKQFVEGKFPDEEGKLQTVEKSDLGQFDLETVINVFNRFTGQETPPK